MVMHRTIPARFKYRSGTTTVVNGTIADGSITASKIADQTITTNQLSEQILKYLKPEITQQPTTTTIFAGSNHTISVSAEGKYLTYQWKKNGTALAGETNATLTITDANATQHDGNYSVVVSNDFGSVESGKVELLILSWSPISINGMEIWLDSSDVDTIQQSSNRVSTWIDKSGNENNASQITDSLRPTFGQDDNGSFVLFTSSVLDSALINSDNFLVLSSGISARSCFFIVDHDGTYFSFLLGSIESTKGYIFIGRETYAISIDGDGNYDSGSWYYNGQFQASGGDIGSSGSIATNSPSMNGIVYNSNDPAELFYRIGSYLGDKGGFGGKIREIVTFDSYLSDTERQKVEGYLAHKWNLATELPSDHPYKNSAP